MHVRTCRQNICTHMPGTVTSMHAHDTNTQTHPGAHCMHAHMHTHTSTHAFRHLHTQAHATADRLPDGHRHTGLHSNTDTSTYRDTQTYLIHKQTHTLQAHRHRHSHCHKYAHTHRCNSTPACMCLNMSTHNRHGLAAICFALCARLCHSRAGMACRPDYPVMSRLISGA